MRINKFIAKSGTASRRQADKLIEEKRVKINNKLAKIGDRVSESDVVFLDSRELKLVKKTVILAFNKPVGLECTANKDVKNNIIEYINYPQRIFTIGRLDKNSSGLIFLSNDGDLAYKLSKTANMYQKEYEVRVDRKISDTDLKKLSEGVEILGQKTLKAKTERVSDTEFKIVICQGLNRQIRRMCEALSYKVKTLNRIRIVNYELGNLKKGEYKEIEQEEIFE